MSEPAQLISVSELDEKLRPILRDLRHSSQHIRALAVITTDGIIVSAIMDDSVDADRFGAMSASSLSLAEITSLELQQGKLKQVLIEGEEGYILTIGAGQNAVLSLVASGTANLGMLFVEAKRTAVLVEEIVS